MKKLLELAKRHNVTITFPIHDEYEAVGTPENLRAFMLDAALPKLALRLDTLGDHILKKEWKK